MSREWIQLQDSGRKYFPLDPLRSVPTIRDIAFALGRTFRFFRQTDLTVAQHSVAVCLSLPDEHKLEGLIHDCAEAISPCGDIPRPIKANASLAEIVDYEQEAERLISLIFRKDLAHTEIIKVADHAACMAEARRFFGDMTEEWSFDWVHDKAWSWKIDRSIYRKAWSPRFASMVWLNVYKRLVRRGLAPQPIRLADPNGDFLAPVEFVVIS